MQNRMKQWGKRGNFAIMMPAIVLVLMGFGAFVFDLGYVGLVRSRMQTAADAAALAATKKLDGTTAGVSAARSEAAAVVALNDPNGELSFDPSRDITFGYWNELQQTFDPNAPVFVWNAARLTVQQSAARGNAIRPFFASVFGVSSMDARVQSSAFSKASYGDPEDTTGVPGGHFDVETSDELSDLRGSCGGFTNCGEMNTDGHVHEYDNAFSTISYNARNPGEIDGTRNPGVLHSIQEDTSGKGSFKIVVANADLSPGINIIINGVSQKITEYADIPFDSLPTYTADTLTELRLSVHTDAIETRSLHRTQPDCVWYNREGAEGEWRNGALTVQAVSASGSIDLEIPAQGGQGVAADGLLHEIIMFWHGPGSCYHRSTWEAEWNVIGNHKSHIILN